MVNIKACKNATNNSKTVINKAKGTEIAATPAFSKIFSVINLSSFKNECEEFKKKMSEVGGVINISDIKVNDQLRFGERVLGIVTIDTKNLQQVNKYRIKDKNFIGGPNLWVNDNLGKFSTLGLDSESVEKPKHLYQILTNTGNFTVDGIQFMDYNSAIEQIMGDSWTTDESLFSV